MKISNQLSMLSARSLHLLNESEAVLGAAEEFVEAVRRSKKMETREEIVRALEPELRKAFREQGRVFMAEFRSRLRSQFEEGFEGHARFLGIPMKEAMGMLDWLVAWIVATDKTAKLFSIPIDQAVETALSLGAAERLGELGVGISFDLANPAAVAYLQDYGADLVAGVNDTSKGIIQSIITQSVEEGWSYDKTAEALMEKFGEFAEGRPQDHIDSRAHGIAVTEVGNAYAEGNLQAAQQLQAAGIPMEKFWDTVGDNKVNQAICGANEAQGWIPLNDAFQSGHQRPLGHPYCRCDLLTRMKE